MNVPSGKMNSDSSSSDADEGSGRGRAPAFDMDVARASQDGAQDRIARQPRLGREPHRDRQDREQDHHVEIAGVVGHDHRRARRLDLTDAASRDRRLAARDAQEQPGEGADRPPRAMRRALEGDRNPERRNEHGDERPYQQRVDQHARGGDGATQAPADDPPRRAAPIAATSTHVRRAAGLPCTSRAWPLGESCRSTSSKPCRARAMTTTSGGIPIASTTRATMPASSASTSAASRSRDSATIDEPLGARVRVARRRTRRHSRGGCRRPRPRLPRLPAARCCGRPR